MPPHLQTVYIALVCQGHWFNVKVTGAKNTFVYGVHWWSGFDWKAVVLFIVPCRLIICGQKLLLLAAW